MLLRDVHYVHNRACRAAVVVDHWIDCADLCVFPSVDDLFDLAQGEAVVTDSNLTGVRYEPRGFHGTWHLEEECPFRGR